MQTQNLFAYFCSFQIVSSQPDSSLPQLNADTIALITKNRPLVSFLEDCCLSLDHFFVTQLKIFLGPFQKPTRNIAYQCMVLQHELVFMNSQTENRQAKIGKL